jgi:hypothetical protein
MGKPNGIYWSPRQDAVNWGKHVSPLSGRTLSLHTRARRIKQKMAKLEVVAKPGWARIVPSRLDGELRHGPTQLTSQERRYGSG